MKTEQIHALAASNPGLSQLSVFLVEGNDAQMSTFHWGNFSETFAKAAVMADIGNCLSFKRMICCILRQQRAETSKCLQKKPKKLQKTYFGSLLNIDMHILMILFAHCLQTLQLMFTHTTGIEITKNKIFIVYKDHNDNIQQQLCFF